MLSNNKNATAGRSTPKGQANEDQAPTSTKAQDHTLVKALQDLVIRVMNPKQTTDMNQIHLEPEAGKLITALQEFISSIIVRSQPEAQNTMIEVSLDEETNEVQELTSVTTESHDLDVPRSSLPTFDEKLQGALRERVFNKMPIRLLSFSQRGSGLQITLLERGAIFARFLSIVKGKMRKEGLNPKKRSGGAETDEKIINRFISKYARYAILSHTWLRTTSGEVTYSDWNKGVFNTDDPGYRKLANFCKAAWKDHGIAFGWMDTVCINKDCSSELDESIRSMYDWYERAAVCINYLAETETMANMYLDPWFTRGWTLQELVAPQLFKFYNNHWKRLVESSDNDKENAEIANQIERATTITRDELQYIRGTPISRRMQMAARREVTREEDTAYSLMGIFDVSISTAYGEGAPRAFFRLLQEILVSSPNVLEILNWAGKLPNAFSWPYNSRVLPTSPRYYTHRSSNERLQLRRPTEPLTLSHMGLRVPLILMPGLWDQGTPQHDSIGDYNANVTISPVGLNHDVPTTYNLLDSRISGEDGWKNTGGYQMTFAVFNFGGAPDITYLPETCIAIGLKCYDASGQVSNTGRFSIIRTKDPVVFELTNKAAVNVVSRDPDYWYWHIKTDELAKHGMQLINMYL